MKTTLFAILAGRSLSSILLIVEWVFTFLSELAVACWCVHCLGGLGSCISPCLASIGDS